MSYYKFWILHEKLHDEIKIAISKAVQILAAAKINDRPNWRRFAAQFGMLWRLQICLPEFFMQYPSKEEEQQSVCQMG